MFGKSPWRFPDKDIDWRDVRQCAREYGLVYIVKVGHGYYKIGVTTNIHGRFKAFKMTNPYVIDSEQVVALIAPRVLSLDSRYDGPLGSYALESCIHRHLSEKGKCFRNEIFKLDNSDLEDLFKFLQENSKVSNRKIKEPRLVNYLLRRRDVKNLLNFNAQTHCSFTGRQKKNKETS